MSMMAAFLCDSLLVMFSLRCCATLFCSSRRLYCHFQVLVRADWGGGIGVAKIFDCGRRPWLVGPVLFVN